MKIAIIPARGGSKRILKKNIKLFNGKPIIAYAIENAINSKLFDEIIVSTDDKEIAGIAKKYGAKVPFLRSQKNSDDFASTFDVIEEVIDFYSENEVCKYSYACCIYPCTPLLDTSILQLSYDKLINQKFDLVYPIVKYGYPIQRALIIDNNNKVQMLHPEHLFSRSQDLDETYHDAGQFYFFNVHEIMAQKKILTSNTGCVIVSEMDVQDIDTHEDWLLAENKYKLKYLSFEN
jgi:pseudaminic acid cytidylyltransferase